MMGFCSRMNLVDPSKSSSTMESRLTKYAFRGFRVAVPGYSPELASCPSFYKLQLILLQMACCTHSLHVSIGSSPPTLAG